MRLLLFTYGTLQRNNVRNYLLEDGRFLDVAETTAGWMFRDRGDFPLMIELSDLQKKSDEPFTRVKGELWEVNEDIIKELDEIEGHPSFFKRMSVLIDTPHALAREVISYVIPDCNKRAWWYKDSILKMPEIPSGSWNKPEHAKYTATLGQFKLGMK